MEITDRTSPTWRSFKKKKKERGIENTKKRTNETPKKLGFNRCDTALARLIRCWTALQICDKLFVFTGTTHSSIFLGLPSCILASCADGYWTTYFPVSMREILFFSGHMGELWEGIYELLASECFSLHPCYKLRRILAFINMAASLQHLSGV